jgi:hypothetical protein
VEDPLSRFLDLSRSVCKHGRHTQAILISDLLIFKILLRGSSTDASYQVLDDLVKQFQRRRILEIDQSETRISCGGHVC